MVFLTSGETPPRVHVVGFSSHTIFPFYRCPSRRGRTHHLHETIHVVLRDAIDVDAVPISTHDKDDVLCVAFCASTTRHRKVRRMSEWSMRKRRAKHGTHIIHAFSLARTNSDVDRNGTQLTAATVSASRRRGPDSPAAKISI